MGKLKQQFGSRQADHLKLKKQTKQVETRNHSKNGAHSEKPNELENLKGNKMKQFVVTLTKQGQTAMKIIVHAQNQQDAKRQALSMHPGWNVNRIDS